MRMIRTEPFAVFHVERMKEQDKVLGGRIVRQSNNMSAFSKNIEYDKAFTLTPPENKFIIVIMEYSVESHSISLSQVRIVARPSRQTPA